MNYYQYWAKTQEEEGSFKIHLLPYHGLDVAACLHVLLREEILWVNKLSEGLGITGARALEILPFMYALHDAGKFSRDFQSFSPEALAELGITPYKRSQNFPIRHDIALHYLLDMGLLDFFQEEKIILSDDPYLLHKLFVSVSGHHGYPTPVYRNLNARELYGNNETAAWRNVKRQFDNEALQDILDYAKALVPVFKGPFHIELIPLEHDPKYIMATWLLAGVGTLADWLGSSSYFQFCTEIMPLQEYWENHALPQAEKAVRDSGLQSSSIQKSKSFFSGILPEHAVARPLQQRASELTWKPSGKKLVIVEDAPGSGKTEAALAIAKSWIDSGDVATGIYFALPTQASSNAMFGRIREFCDSLFSETEKGTLGLAHGATILSEKFSEIKVRTHGTKTPYKVEFTEWMDDSRKKTLLAQIAVGTIDQALIASLPRYHSNLRQAALARKILIVDEVHAYDEYQTELLRSLLRFCGLLEIPVILLSATLHHELRQKLISSYTGNQEEVDKQASYPLVTVYEEELEEIPTEAHRTRSYVIDVIEDTQAKLSEREWSRAEQEALGRVVYKAREEGGCAIWFRNTVGDAILAYEHVAEELGPENVILAHSRFTRFHRKEIDDKAVTLFGKGGGPQERAGKVVICTQVFQESLDLDFDYAVIDLAPVDVMMQRMGRVCRHKRKKDGTLVEDPNFVDERGEPVLISVLMPEFENEPDEKWVKKLSMERTSFVYKGVHQLWRTAKLALQHPEWDLPQDVRFLMESVYGPEAENPEGLLEALYSKEGGDAADRAIGRNRTFDWQKGWSGNTLKWTEDDDQKGVPTRLSDPTILWRLARYENGEIKPFEEELGLDKRLSPRSRQYLTWEYNQLSLRTSIISEPEYGPDILKALERQKGLDKRDPLHLYEASWVKYLIFEKKEEECKGRASWTVSGISLCPRGRPSPRVLTYDSVIGCVPYQRGEGSRKVLEGER